MTSRFSPEPGCSVRAGDGEGGVKGGAVVRDRKTRKAGCLHEVPGGRGHCFWFLVSFFVLMACGILVP